MYHPSFFCLLISSFFNNRLSKQEEHFCAVYFKDENTGWKVAEEFLQKVVSTITTYLSNENWEKEIGVPQKCREYYTDMNTGWWVGWCYNNLVIQ